jgi:hypothetical protein
VLGLPPNKVHGICVPGPGSSGRNHAGDAGIDATLLLKAVSRPVGTLLLVARQIARSGEKRGEVLDQQTANLVLEGRSGASQGDGRRERPRAVSVHTDDTLPSIDPGYGRSFWISKHSW